MIVVDTNVASELMRPEPSSVVVAWLRARRTDELFTTAITLAEILFGIERLPDGRRKEGLSTAASEVFSSFPDQILPFDEIAAAEYAKVVEARERAGSPIDGFDAQIASICRVHRASLATRNLKDFADTGIVVIDPWHDAS